jgi:hypothetical protein
MINNYIYITLIQTNWLHSFKFELVANKMNTSNFKVKFTINTQKKKGKQVSNARYEMVTVMLLNSYVF